MRKKVARVPQGRGLKKFVPIKKKRNVDYSYAATDNINALLDK